MYLSNMIVLWFRICSINSAAQLCGGFHVILFVECYHFIYVLNLCCRRWIQERKSSQCWQWRFAQYQVSKPEWSCWTVHKTSFCCVSQSWELFSQCAIVYVYCRFLISLKPLNALKNLFWIAVELIALWLKAFSSNRLIAFGCTEEFVLCTATIHVWAEMQCWKVMLLIIYKVIPDVFLGLVYIQPKFKCFNFTCTVDIDLSVMVYFFQKTGRTTQQC
jgi:hypothetical protein